MLVNCPSALVHTTLNQLREAGQGRCECAVLWLGRRDGTEGSGLRMSIGRFKRLEADMFHIPPAGDEQPSMPSYANCRFMVAAQVHSHPRQAFHSQADNRVGNCPS